jgi:hypothetical protein
VNQHLLPTLLSGDIVLQTSHSDQSPAIQAATNSVFTHCGIYADGWVFEAVQPVRRTPLRTWIEKDEASFVAMRVSIYRDGLPRSVFAKMEQWVREQMGKNYDKKFLWDDLRLYCSEFVWKAYNAAGIRVCEQSHVRDLNLSHPIVKALINARFGSIKNVPMDEIIVPPSALATSPSLYRVYPLN